MDKKLSSVIALIPRTDLTHVARGVLGSPDAELSGSPDWSEITSPHNDLRTIGILRVAGNARTEQGPSAWSSVVKLIDPSVDPGAAAHWINPEIEEIVYQARLFASDELSFRPAHCYAVTSTADGIKLLWLEDLDHATAPPFDVSQLGDIAEHLGDFNGFHYRHEADLPFEPAVDSYKVRWDTGAFLNEVHNLRSISEDSVTKTVFKAATIDSALEFHALMLDLHRRLVGQKRSISFGDSAPGNLFLNGQETVAIDWTGVTLDPVGVDLGVLVGAAMTSGKSGGLVAENEQDIFESYLKSLRRHEPGIDPTDVRRGYLGQLGFYIALAAVTPATFASPGKYFRKDFIEKRFETPYEDIPALLTGVVDLIPEFIEELKRLLRP